eukprot:Skav209891  [mRNA]  locus=scaffold2642:367110:367926:- [translate_table: standard]
MGDGTPAMGKRHKKTHGLCPRCGKRSYHIQSYLKHVGKRFKNGFREGGAPPARKKKPAEK